MIFAKNDTVRIQGITPFGDEVCISVNVAGAIDYHPAVYFVSM